MSIGNWKEKKRKQKVPGLLWPFLFSRVSLHLLREKDDGEESKPN